MDRYFFRFEFKRIWKDAILAYILFLLSIFSLGYTEQIQNYDIIVDASRSKTATKHDSKIPTFSTMIQARDYARQYHSNNPGKMCLIGIHAGIHFMDSPLLLDSRDSSTSWIGMDNEDSILTTAMKTDLWHQNSDGSWQLKYSDIPELNRDPSVLVIEGTMMPINRFPEVGTLHFRFPPLCSELLGGFRFRSERASISITDFPSNFLFSSALQIIVPHYWVDSHLKIKSFDRLTGRIEFLAASNFRLSNDFIPTPAEYWIENSPSPLIPGHWRFDTKKKLIIYMPIRFQKLSSSSFLVGSKNSVIDIHGNSGKDNPISNVTLRHLCVIGGDALMPTDFTNEDQAACNVPAAIHIQSARNCLIYDCNIHDCLGYGIAVADACAFCSIQGNRINHMGAGAIKVTGGTHGSPDWNLTHKISIKSNCISHYGEYFHNSVAILLQHASDCSICNNSISYGDYSAISIGWTWGHWPNVTKNNLIDNNRIDNIGQGVLSDLAGIYTLGVQGGTRISHNYISNVRCRKYDGWGIYLDEGSSDLLVTNNIVYNTSSGSFYLHYGTNNHISNNIFLFGHTSQLRIGKSDIDTSLYFDHNIIMWASGESLVGPWNSHSVHSKENCWWCLNSQSARFLGLHFDDFEKSGNDIESIFSDPKLMDPEHGDFRLGNNSPAKSLGCYNIKLNEN